MHVRFTTAVGMDVMDEESMEKLGSIEGILIHPDTAKVEGFFVRIRHFLSSETLFLSSLDICRYGTRVYLRNAEALSPLEDLVRLTVLAEEGRPVLGQKIVTESGRDLGTCADVQFDTLHFLVEWLFPKTLLRWGLPIAVSQIVEVKPEAIIVKETAAPIEAKESSAVPLLEMPEAA